MPIYAYQCHHCRVSQDIIKRVADLERMEPCEVCKAPMDRRICAPAVVADYAGYTCPISDKWIEGRRAHEENLKRHGCRVLEAGETDQVRRSREAEECALDRQVDDTVERFYEALPTVKREQLAAEITSGLDVSIDRK